jgi:uncharacterized protein
MLILSRTQCIEILDKFDMPQHIRMHSFLVAEVALFLGRQLNLNDSGLNLRLIEAAALLHDIGKQRSLQTREDHAVLGAQMLDGMVHPAVSEIVRDHIYLDNSHIEGPLTESILVNYSDKRVKHDQVVSVRDRYHDLIERYAKSPAHRQLLLDKLDLYFELEQRIFSRLTISPLSTEIMGLTVDHIKGAGSEYHGNEKTHCSVAGGREVC